MPRPDAYPLDYSTRDYAYLERPNRALLGLFERRVLVRTKAPRVLDVGAGAGANASALRRLAPGASIVALEPNPQAASLLRATCDEVYETTLETWSDAELAHSFDAVLLSDVIEHTADPVRFLRRLVGLESTRRATFLVSVPNYAVWYNRVRTVFGRFDYTWSGLYDRTHLRFFTRRSLRELLYHCELEVRAESATPSLVQSMAPLLRRAFDADVDAGHHLALGDSRAFRAYETWVEPAESRVCSLWPELFAFQIVVAAERR